MHSRAVHRVAAALVLSVVLNSASGGAYVSSIAESAHRRNRARRQRRTEYGAVHASLIHEQYAYELRILTPPPSCVYVRPR